VTIEQAFAETASADDLPGTVLDDRTIATGSGRLRIDQLKPAGKRSMSWADFCNGYRVRPGDRFGTPAA
jgi:methionyl-tRNA formyltransferase